MHTAQRLAPSRRNLLKSAGALVVSIGAPMPFDPARAAEDALVAGAKPALTPDQLSSYRGECRRHGLGLLRQD